MSEYSPDVWVILKLTFGDTHHYRVFAGWYGGYAGSDSWKMNSGITEVKDMGNYYDFYGESGSVYHCNKQCEKMSMYMQSVLGSYQKAQTEENRIEVIDFKDMKL